MTSLESLKSMSEDQRKSLLSQLSPEDRATLSDLWSEHNRTHGQNSIDQYFPDTGPIRRALYKKHMQFFEAGVSERERAFIAANRIGKSTTAGGYETALHLTGIYPPWWKGRRFTRPVRWWAAGDTGETVREIIQPILFGDPGQIGTGLIRGRTIDRINTRRGSPEAIEMAYIRHQSGGLSSLLFKSYEQGRKAFQGTKMDGIWLDEECSMSIYTECLLRLTATTPEGNDWGSLLATFTPLLGISEVVLRFLGEDMGQSVESQADVMRREFQQRTLEDPPRATPGRDLMGDTTAAPRVISDESLLGSR